MCTCSEHVLWYAWLDGCFIKLCTRAQILAATGRDGNNNMYPIAFVVVPKEDTANWCWFLTQLKYALGGDEGKFGKYTFMSDKMCAMFSDAILVLMMFCDAMVMLMVIQCNSYANVAMVMLVVIDD
jgi:hypothetical protein